MTLENLKQYVTTCYRHWTTSIDFCCLFVCAFKLKNFSKELNPQPYTSFIFMYLFVCLFLNLRQGLPELQVVILQHQPP